MSDGDDTPSGSVRPGESSLRLDGATPDPDDLFRALSHARRRRALYCLLDRDRNRGRGRRDVDELCEELADPRAGDRGARGPDRRRRIRVDLHHSHLPILDDVGMIEYDRDAGDVRLTPLAGAVEDLLRFADEYDRAVDATVG